MDIEKIFHTISGDSGLPDYEKKLISNAFELQKYRRNSVLLHQNADCKNIYFVIKGALRIYYFNDVTTEVTRAIVLENAFCTNLLSFTGQAENTENISCLEDSLVYSISRENFRDLLDKSHIISKLYATTLESFIAKHLRHFQLMNTLNPRQRVEYFLTFETELNKRIKDKIIATYLGVSPEFFSRAKADFFRRAGIS